MRKTKIIWTNANISLCKVRKSYKLPCKDCILAHACDKKEKQLEQKKEGKEYV